MSKLVEAAAEFLARDTSTKGNEFSEAMHPMKKKMEAMHPMKKGKKEMDESFLLSQEEFQSLSEEDREYYIDQLMELKKATLEAMHPMKKKM